MPLIKRPSKKAFDHNMKAEMDAGKPQDQSLAIAYDVQRRSKKKMARGGMVEQDRMAADASAPATPMRKPDNRRLPMDEYMAPKMADGGEVAPRSISEAIMRKRKMMMAEGGEVDLDCYEDPANPNGYDDENMDAVMKELYDDYQIGPEPMDSNEHGDDIESDKHDMVSMIRRKMRMGR